MMKTTTFSHFFLGLLALGASSFAKAQTKKPFKIIAYYTGDSAQINKYNIGELDELIYCFAKVEKGILSFRNHKDTITMEKVSALKKQFPKLKVVISLGGWSGCAPCSEAFSTEKGRSIFAQSVLQTMKHFDADGIDLDWEYPVIEGYPGHLHQPTDKDNFTDLIVKLRKNLGKKYILSFAAGGFQKYLDSSINWKAVAPIVDYINIMSYDLVNGYSKVTGHHTPLFSTHAKEESTDNAVQYLLKEGIDPQKIVIGGAFYTRTWKNVAAKNNGLYQSGEPVEGVDFVHQDQELTAAKGWKYFWDKKAQAPFWYNADKKLFATSDNLPSIIAKTNYALQKHLGGIMFWELLLDKPKDGMVQAIYDERQKFESKK